MAKVGPKNVLIAPKLDESLPAHLREGDSKGMELVKQFVTPPRLKVVQRQSLPPLIDLFSPGDVISLPSQQLMFPVIKGEGGRPTSNGTPFHFVPLFFYPEWVHWNPMEAKGTLAAIRSRTIDPRSEVAIRSKSPDTWSAPCREMPKDKNGKELFTRFVEHLNFVIWLPFMKDNPLGDQFVTLSFARGEHRAGTGFAGLMQARNAKQPFACCFEAAVGPRERNGNAWLGFDVTNPSAESGVDPWVRDEQTFRTYERLHDSLAETHRAGLLVADLEDDVVEGAVVGNAESTKY